MNFIAFDFISLSDLNSNPNNIVEILFSRAFLVECLMCLDILLIALKISSLSGSVLTNLQSRSCFIAFYLFISFSMNTPVAVSIFINLYCKFIVMKI